MTSGPHAQVRLSPKQVVFLFVVTAVVGVLVFLCGVLVGRGVPLAQMLSGELDNVRTAAFDASEPPAVVSTPRREPATAALAGADLTYPERLGGPFTAVRDALGALPAASRERAPADGPSPTQPIITPVRESGYALQVSALRDRTAAEQLAKRLTERGYPAFVAIPLESAPIAMFTVRVGPFADRPEAEQVLERLESEDAFSPWITR
ncbi:MAG: SPOR domain-containing protein [Acidobacteria bacterium]|nr:SPOR domain-containing protein [Acidobacteriota bacterium]MXZ70268.1 SPOR domain-containing protein [Acidobacteriota bacterium]MYD69716.1 SPOR domain-containing protein [Acidobacteriota bacterium]MYJ03591.1 SPOR domain-containing protein [Acidobacteriota bacterium]